MAWQVVPVDGTPNSHVVPTIGREHTLNDTCWCAPTKREEIYKDTFYWVLVHHMDN